MNPIPQARQRILFHGHYFHLPNDKLSMGLLCACGLSKQRYTISVTQRRRNAIVPKCKKYKSTPQKAKKA